MLASLPSSALRHVLLALAESGSVRDVLALCVAYPPAYTSVARDDEGLWRTCLLREFPEAAESAPARDAVRERCALVKKDKANVGFLQVADKLAHLTRKAEEGDRAAEEAVNCAVSAAFGVGCAQLRSGGALVRTTVARRAAVDMAKWATEGTPQSRALAALLSDLAYRIVEGDDFSTVPLQRSAAEFCKEAASAHGKDAEGSVSVILLRALDDVDACVENLRAEGANTSVHRPSEIPRSHSWFFPYGYGANGYHVC